LGDKEMIVSIFYLCSKVGEMEEFSEKACIFCEIVGGRAPSHKIYEDDLTLCHPGYQSLIERPGSGDPQEACSLVA
jgi:hypothetical protein